MKFSKLDRATLSGWLKRIGAACMMAAAAITASAADTSDVRLNVELKNGNTDTFYLADKPELTFNDDECVISCNAVNVSYDMADVVKSYFTKGTLSVTDNLADGIKVDLTDSTVAVVSGMAPGTAVALYGIDGTMIQTLQADFDGTARISLYDLAPKTIYIVSINSTKNFKIYKK